MNISKERKALFHRVKYREIALVFALLATFVFVPWTGAAAASAADFTDVPSGAWYRGAVDYVVSQGLFNGMSDTVFSPGGTMTRGMFVTVLGRYAGVDPAAWCAGTVTGSAVNLRSGPGTGYDVLASLGRGSAVTITGESGNWYRVRSGSTAGYISKDYLAPSYHRFADVDYGKYYAGYVIWGYERGIVNGMSDTSFAPERNVTREQICKLLAGYADYAGVTLRDDGSSVTFTDQGSISAWALAGVAAMQRAGVVMGEAAEGGYRFRPGSSATRAEAAAIFQRFAAAGTGGRSETGPEPRDPEPPQETEAPGGDVGQTVTPASLKDGTIAVGPRTVRVGILANTRYTSNAVSSAELENLEGYGFLYGYYDGDRGFRQEGELAQAKLTVTSDGSNITVSAGGETVLTRAGELALVPASDGAGVTCVNGEYRYRGGFSLRPAYNAAGYVSVVNYVDIEDYVKGVVPFEYGHTWPAEALKAAAVCVRTYVMSTDWSAYAPYGFDVMGDASAQNYRGRAITYSESYFTETDAAADATAGLYLTWSDGGTDRLCTTYYFSCDGGATEDYAHVWGGSGYSYLIGKPDPYEAAVSASAANYTYAITESRTGSTLTALAGKLGLGTVAPGGIRVETYPATGNVKSVTVTDTDGGSAVIDQSSSFGRWDFLSAFGFTVYSYRYSVAYDASADAFTCTRLGWGHGIGLSQWGAYAMASQYGKTYGEILGFYYDGTHLQYGAY